MRRATITIGDELESSLDAFIRQTEAPPALTTIVQTALREYLARRGFGPGPRKFHITPSKKGSGIRDVSISHDAYLADQ